MQEQELRTRPASSWLRAGAVAAMLALPLAASRTAGLHPRRRRPDGRAGQQLPAGGLPAPGPAARRDRLHPGLWLVRRGAARRPARLGLCRHPRVPLPDAAGAAGTTTARSSACRSSPSRIGNYWGRYYRDRPWYREPRWWGGRPPPPPVAGWRPPPPPRPDWRPHPGRRRPRIRAGLPSAAAAGLAAVAGPASAAGPRCPAAASRPRRPAAGARGRTCRPRRRHPACVRRTTAAAAPDAHRDVAPATHRRRRRPRLPGPVARRGHGSGPVNRGRLARRPAATGEPGAGRAL